jgi:lysophospholipase L1-like esterase
MKLLRVLLVVAGAAAVLPAQDHWVATWATAESLARGPAPAPNPNAAQPKQGAPTINARGFDNQTVRMIARTSMAGKRVRVKLENAFGSAPVKVGAAHIALRDKDSAIVTATDRALTFNGEPGVTLGPGAVIASDPVELTVPALSEVAVSLFFPAETGAPTNHGTALHNTYVTDGDATAKASLDEPTVTQAYYYLAAIDVMAPANAFSIVTYGDSITDGTRSSNEGNHSWPALLAARLAAKRETASIGIANLGISGNRVLRDGAGVSAVARFDRDVLSQSGVKWVMLREGINDIGREASNPAEMVEANDVIGGYKQIIDQAHTHGLKIIGCTLTPYGSAGYQREHGESVRQKVNEWIRTSGAFDAVADFEKATRDASTPPKIRAEFDPGDHLHPNDAGYQAMADAVDLAVFTKKK